MGIEVYRVRCQAIGAFRHEGLDRGKRPTVFGGEYEVKINNRKGLRHGSTPGMGHNAVDVEGFVDMVSQGSRCAATLG